MFYLFLQNEYLHKKENQICKITFYYFFFICIDIEKNDPKHFEHGALPSNSYVLDLVYKAILGNPEKGDHQWWTKTGKSDIYLERKKFFGVDKESFKLP